MPAPAWAAEELSLAGTGTLRRGWRGAFLLPFLRSSLHRRAKRSGAASARGGAWGRREGAHSAGASPAARPDGRSCSPAAAGANLQSLASGDSGSHAAVPEDRSTTISQFIHLQVRRGGFQARQLPPDFLPFFSVAAGAGSRFSSSPSPGGRRDGAGKELKPLKLTAQVVPPSHAHFFCC